MKKPIAWSYSKLNSFETCPKKFYHNTIAKDFKESESDVMRYGKEVHTAIEKRIAMGLKFPLHLTHLEPIVAKFADANGTKLVEQQLAINENFQPTGWFDNDVWCRTVIDLAIVGGEHAVLVDWKTGRMSDDFTQQRLAAAIFFIYHPEVKSADIMYYWLKDKKPTVEQLNREDVKHVWAPLIKRVQKFNLAHKTTDFPPRPGGLCKRYCPVTTCPHHGG